MIAPAMLFEISRAGRVARIGCELVALQISVSPAGAAPSCDRQPDI
jgi:hypothetical protein